jgi:hypothetical protein
MFKKLSCLYKLSLLRSCLKRSVVWYVDIPRTGSTFLRDSLFKELGYPHGKAGIAAKKRERSSVEFFGPHSTAEQVRQIIGAELWTSLFTFSVVRNPFDRVASLFLYYKNTEKLGAGDFKDFCHAIRGLLFWNEQSRPHPPLWRTQKSYLFDRQNNLLVKEVGKYENFAKFLDVVRKKTGLLLPNTYIFNPSLGKPQEGGLRAIYDSSTARLVSDFFQEDFEAFGYSNRL